MIRPERVLEVCYRLRGIGLSRGAVRSRKKSRQKTGAGSHLGIEQLNCPDLVVVRVIFRLQGDLKGLETQRLLFLWHILVTLRLHETHTHDGNEKLGVFDR